MSQIGSLASSAAATFDLSYLPQFLQIGTVENTDSLSSLAISARGRNLITLANAAQIDCLMKLESDAILDGSNSALGKRLLLSDGRINGQSVVNITNGSATTTAVYENSFNQSRKNNARQIAVTPVVASGNNAFINFDVIYFLPANVDRLELTYESGWTEPVSAVEAAGIYSSNFDAESDGYVEGFCVVAGYRGKDGSKVKSCKVFATSGGNVDVVVCGWQTI